jgi:hypothetical protein
MQHVKVKDRSQTEPPRRHLSPCSRASRTSSLSTQVRIAGLADRPMAAPAGLPDGNSSLIAVLIRVGSCGGCGSPSRGRAMASRLIGLQCRGLLCYEPRPILSAEEASRVRPGGMAMC